ncbi:MAG: deoxyribose-phosphate aldolase [Candidatus Sumerlaeota bacterium]|nr:deoxyribose-phosphate aldolase [Candidatus Sumerlaeota bacterium]
MGDKLKRQIAKMIDHSLLKPTMTDRELEEGCAVALRYDVASVCIKPYYMARCAALLRGSTVVPSCVIGFPHGGHRADVKLYEAEKALLDGGIELDVVNNIGKVLSHDWPYVEAELRALTDLIHRGGGKIKVIFENAYLKDEEKIVLCKICGGLGVDWVKTSTGYADKGATPHDLKLMVASVPRTTQVKAAGGVRVLRAAVMVRDIGATRFGATATVPICDEAAKASDALLAPQPIADSFDAPWADGVQYPRLPDGAPDFSKMTQDQKMDYLQRERDRIFGL